MFLKLKKIKTQLIKLYEFLLNYNNNYNFKGN